MNKKMLNKNFEIDVKNNREMLHMCLKIEEFTARVQKQHFS